MNTDPQATVDPFDRLLGSLHGLPDVVSTRQATVRALTPLVGSSETFIIQTYRQRLDDARSLDTIFIEYIGKDRSLRLVLPSGVADVIARQRDQLGALNRRKAARRLAQERKDKGIQPAFLKPKKQA